MLMLRVGIVGLWLMSSLPFLLPIHTTPIPSFHAEWLAAVLGLIASIALIDARRMPLPGATLLSLVLAGIVAIQALLGRAPVPQLTEMFGLYLLWAALLACTASHLAQRLGIVKVTKALATAILIGSALAAIAAILQPLLKQVVGWTGFGPGAGGALAQRNHFADYLWLGLASALYLRSVGALSRALFWLTAVLLTLAAALGGQRSSFLYAAALIAVALWQARAWKIAGHASTHRALGIVAIFVVMQPVTAVLPRISTYDGVPPPAMRAISEAAGPSIRLQLANLAVKGTVSAPVLGNGIGSFPGLALSFADEVPPADNPGPAEHSHNLFLDVAVELGVPAALLMLATGAAWARGLTRRPEIAEVTWAATAAAIIALHCMIEYALWHTYFLGLLAVVAGAFGRPRIVGQRLTPLALTLGLVAWGSIILTGLARDYKLLETTVALGRQPATMPLAKEALMRIPARSLLSPWASTVACVSLDPFEVPLDDGLAVCGVARTFAPTVESELNECVLTWRDGKSNLAAGMLRRLTLASSSYDSQKLDALLATAITREPSFGALRHINSNR